MRIAALVLLSALVGCGADSPDDASLEDFCTAQQSLVTHFPADAGDALPSDGQMAQAFRDWGEQMEQVGTPADMPRAARTGFEDMLEALQGVRADDVEGGMVADIEEPADAFTSYVDEACQDFVPDLDDLELPELGE